MMRFTVRMMPTPFGAIAQMTRSLVETTRLKETKVQTPSMEVPAMIRSREVMHPPIESMGAMAMI